MWHVGVWRRPGNCSVVCMRVNRGAARGDRVRSYCWERSGAWTCGSWSRTGFVTAPSVPSPECRDAFFSCWTFHRACTKTSPGGFQEADRFLSERQVIERLWKFLRKKALNRWHKTFEEMQAAVAEVLDQLGEYRDELSTLMTERFAIVEVEPAVA